MSFVFTLPSNAILSESYKIYFTLNSIRFISKYVNTWLWPKFILDLHFWVSPFHFCKNMYIVWKQFVIIQLNAAMYEGQCCFYYQCHFTILKSETCIELLADIRDDQWEAFEPDGTKLREDTNDYFRVLIMK